MILFSTALLGAALVGGDTLVPATSAHEVTTAEAELGSAYGGAYSSAPLVQSGDPRRNGGYFRANFGLTTTAKSNGPGEEIDFDEGYLGAIALGRRMYAEDDGIWALDLEIEGIWSDSDTDDPDGPINAVQDVTALSALVNVVGDARLTNSLSFYGGGGLGLGFLDIGTQSDALNDFDEEEGPFLAWQLKAGLKWYASQTFAWSFGYRFLNIDDATIDDDLGGASFDFETEQHTLELGLTVTL